MIKYSSVTCRFCILIAVLIGTVASFVIPLAKSTTRWTYINDIVVRTLLYSASDSSNTVQLQPVPPAPKDKVIILSDAIAVGDTVRNIVKEAALEAIKERGHFALAIPGGSILKMLVGDDILSGDDSLWTTKTTIVYVNHKCVSMDDTNLATHAEAKKLFLDKWTGVTVIIMDGTDNGQVEATNYENKMKQLSNTVLPRNSKTGLPVFDLALIGVGDDGHIGSLYPNRDEVLIGSVDTIDTNTNDVPWVIPVCMKNPPSITLTLPVMTSAKSVIVAACGVSDKYPQGKSDGMYRAISVSTETIQSFPVVGLRSVATWIMDTAASSKLIF